MNIELCKIYNEDCLVTMSKMLEGSIDLILTSPPYNLMTQVKYNKYIKRVSNKHKSNKYIDFNDGLNPLDFYNLHYKILGEMLRVSKVILYNFQIVSGSKEAFFKLIGDYNTYIKDIIIWDKGRSIPASREKILNSGYEIFLVMESDANLGRTIKNANFSRCELDNILRVNRNKVVIDGVKHNATFPKELCDILVKGFSREGDIVYDPFCGTGTSLLSAKEFNRKWIGSDVSSEYCDLATKRLLK